MFQDTNKIAPDQIPEVVKKVFDGYRTVIDVANTAFRLLKDPAIANMSRTEFLATVASWEEKIKVVTQNVPLKGKG